MRPIAPPLTLLLAGALAISACATDDGTAADDAVDETTAAVPTAGPEEGPGNEEVGEGERSPGVPEGITSVGPPSDEVGVPTTFTPVVFEGDEAAVALSGLTVYSEGVDLVLAVRWAPEQEEGTQSRSGGPLSPDMSGDPPTSAEDLPDRLLRVSVTYPDGSVASATDQLLATVSGEEPEEPVLSPYAGMGSQASWDEQLWAEPLPDSGDGTLEIAVEWPEYGIDDSAELEITGGDVSDAAEQVVTLWN